MLCLPHGAVLMFGDLVCNGRLHPANLLSGRSWVQVAQVAMTGEWENEDAKELLQLGMGGCAQIDAYMRQCLREALSGDSMDE